MLETQYINGGWWVVGLPQTAPGDPAECGPYDTKADAESDRRGLARFYRENPQPRAETSPSPPPQPAPEVLLRL